ncbi:MAG TPA: hypothetical protein DIT31_10055 [Methylophaga sp.]|nr:hypothetical protein [Methylophaga sp.]|tara:strand:+ start:462 stop:1502 length:1041 start_codon:yes stop_codon:yes gene_type:complete
MSNRLDDELSRSMQSEIQMEGATIMGGVPTFEYLNKDYSDEVLGQGTASAQVFTLPNGQKIALVPESQAAEFLASGGVSGLVSQIHGHDVAVDFRDVMTPEAADAVVAAQDTKSRRRILKSDIGKDLKSVDLGLPFQNSDEIRDKSSTSFSFPTLNLGNGFHVVLGATQNYQDQDSFATYEMTDDGPKIVERGQETSSIPIVIYSPPGLSPTGERGPGMLSTTPPKESHLFDQDVHIDRHVELPQGLAAFHDISRSDVDPSVMPSFTGKDIIEGYRVAEAGQRTKRPAPTKPAPAPEPRPEPTSSFSEFRMPIEDTPKGRRRVPERLSNGQQDLTDDYLTNMMRIN